MWPFGIIKLNIGSDTGLKCSIGSNITDLMTSLNKNRLNFLRAQHLLIFIEHIADQLAMDSFSSFEYFIVISSLIIRLGYHGK